MRASRIRLVEIIVAVSVVMISVASLAVAVFQGTVMQRQLAASVLPILDYSHGNYDPDAESREITLTLLNNGLGPAALETVGIWYGDLGPLHLDELLGACCLDSDAGPEARAEEVSQMFRDGRLFAISSDPNGRIVAPDQSITLMNIPFPETGDEQVQAIWRQLDQERWRMSVEVCYCSVFDECWRARFPNHRREPVRSCAAAD